MYRIGIDIGGTQLRIALIDEDYQIVGHEKHHMDEREIVAEHLQKRKQGR